MKRIIKKIIPKHIKNFIKKIIHQYRVFYVNKNFGKGIKSYKNKYNNQRCFIIGNGPSLLIDDLEKLENEITFASHMIFKVFDKTLWRPMFYCIEDIELLENNIETIQSIRGEYKHGFFTGNNWKNLPENFLEYEQNDFWYIDKLIWDDEPDFSLNADKYIAEGFTVTYAIIQLAVYMGFSEIYLLGVDHSYCNGNNYSDAIGNSEIYNTPKLDRSTLSYMKAKSVCENMGIKIVNLTRGGHLEVFERDSFDQVIGDKNEKK